MIVLTGAAGFIGSCMLRFLNDNGHDDVVIVDDFSRTDKVQNYTSKNFIQTLERSNLLDFFEKNSQKISVVIHLGARTDTTEKDKSIFDTLNVDFSKMVWAFCASHQIPLIYASSAATYGLGELGYEDRHDIVSQLKPLNPYGDSKNDFDIWALAQAEKPPFWAGLKFFNVYGPNEYTKTVWLR